MSGLALSCDLYRRALSQNVSLDFGVNIRWCRPHSDWIKLNADAWAGINSGAAYYGCRVVRH